MPGGNSYLNQEEQISMSSISDNSQEEEKIDQTGGLGAVFANIDQENQLCNEVDPTPPVVKSEEAVQETPMHIETSALKQKSKKLILHNQETAEIADFKPRQGEIADSRSDKDDNTQPQVLYMREEAEFYLSEVSSGQSYSSMADYEGNESIRIHTTDGQQAIVPVNDAYEDTDDDVQILNVPRAIARKSHKRNERDTAAQGEVTTAHIEKVTIINDMKKGDTGRSALARLVERHELLRVLGACVQAFTGAAIHESVQPDDSKDYMERCLITMLRQGGITVDVKPAKEGKTLVMYDKAAIYSLCQRVSKLLIIISSEKEVHDGYHNEITQLTSHMHRLSAKAQADEEAIVGLQHQLEVQNAQGAQLQSQMQTIQKEANAHAEAMRIQWEARERSFAEIQQKRETEMREFAKAQSQREAELQAAAQENQRQYQMQLEALTRHKDEALQQQQKLLLDMEKRAIEREQAIAKQYQQASNTANIQKMTMDPTSSVSSTMSQPIAEAKHRRRSSQKAIARQKTVTSQSTVRETANVTNVNTPQVSYPASPDEEKSHLLPESWEDSSDTGLPYYNAHTKTYIPRRARNRNNNRQQESVDDTDWEGDSKMKGVRQLDYESGYESDIWKEEDIGLLSTTAIKANQLGQQWMTSQILAISKDQRDFKGNTYNERAAKKWIKEAIQLYRQAGLEPRQRCYHLSNKFSGPARDWYNQLPKSVRISWTDLVEAFKTEYCEPTTSAAANYWTAQREITEAPLDYLNRLTVLALRAGIKPHSTDELTHIRRFMDSLGERELYTRLEPFRDRSLQQLRSVLREIKIRDSQGRTAIDRTKAKSSRDERQPSKSRRSIQSTRVQLDNDSDVLSNSDQECYSPISSTRQVRFTNIQQSRTCVDRPRRDTDPYADTEHPVSYVQRKNDLQRRSSASSITETERSEEIPMDSACLVIAHTPRLWQEVLRIATVMATSQELLTEEVRHHHDTPPICGRCNKKGHSADNCWSGMRCETCKRLGHTTEVCYERCKGCGFPHDRGQCVLEEIVTRIRAEYDPKKFFISPELARLIKGYAC